MSAPEVTREELIAEGYVVEERGDEFVLRLHGVDIQEDYSDPDEAWAEIIDEVQRERDAEWCDRCGDQACCPDCDDDLRVRR